MDWLSKVNAWFDKSAAEWMQDKVFNKLKEKAK